MLRAITATCLMLGTGLAVGSWLHAASPPTFALPTTAFTLDCDGTYTSEQNFTWGQRYGRSTKQQNQQFRIDPAAMTVEFRYGHVSEAVPWGEKRQVYPIAKITPGGRILLCTRQDDKPCGKMATNTESSGRTLLMNVGQTVIDVRAGNFSHWVIFAVSANDGSAYFDQNMTEGSCRRV